MFLCNNAKLFRLSLYKITKNQVFLVFLDRFTIFFNFAV